MFFYFSLHIQYSIWDNFHAAWITSSRISYSMGCWQHIYQPQFVWKCLYFIQSLLRLFYSQVCCFWCVFCCWLCVTFLSCPSLLFLILTFLFKIYFLIHWLLCDLNSAADSHSVMFFSLVDITLFGFKISSSLFFIVLFICWGFLSFHLL